MCTSMRSNAVAALSCGYMEPNNEKPCEPSFKAIGRLKVSNDTEHASVQLKHACEFHLLMESYTLVLK